MIKTLSVLDQSPIPVGATPAQALANSVDLARRCEALGYFRYWVAEHHSSSALAGSAPEILIGQIAAATSTLRVGSGGVMLSHYSPYKVAETFRMLEAFYPGRIDLGVGRAPGSDQLTAAALANGPRRDTEENFPRAIVDLVRWMHDSIEPEHRFAAVKAQPVAPTAPDVWLLGSSDYSAMLAAHLGLPFSFAHFINPGWGPTVMDAYRREFKPSVLLDEPVASIGVSVLCADTAEEAERLAAPLRLWRVWLRTRQDPGAIPTYEQAMNHRYTELEQRVLDESSARLITGDPAYCKAEMEALAAQYQVEELVVVTITADHASRCRSYELIADAFGLS